MAKVVYCLRIRFDDDSPWSEPDHFDTRRERDEAAAMNRALAGIRTHSYQEKIQEPTHAD